MRVHAGLMILSAGLLGTGCQRVNYTASEEAKYFRPVVSVMNLECRAPVRMKWNVGQGMTEQLSDRLRLTKRYVVMEPGQGGKGRGREPEGRTLQYLIKGKITDFGIIKDTEKGMMDWGPFRSDGQAIAAGTFYVVDVQTGEVIATKTVEGRANVQNPKPEKIVVEEKVKGTGKDKGKDTVKKKTIEKPRPPIDYNTMAFGGSTFYDTPMGEATNAMLEKAVAEITRAINEQPFQPKIASIINDRVVINAGQNRRIAVGSVYLVRPRSENVVDPDTGEVLGHVTGKTLGEVQVVQVMERMAIARVLNGYGFEAGQTLFPLSAEGAKRTAERSHY